MCQARSGLLGWAGLAGWAGLLGWWVLYHHLTFSSGCQHGAPMHCLARGGSWQPASCRCQCRPDTWSLCPTGYQYDYVATCSCVLLHSRANISHLIAIILSSILFLSSLGYVQSHSHNNSLKKVGYFCSCLAGSYICYLYFFFYFCFLFILWSDLLKGGKTREKEYRLSNSHIYRS